MAFLEYQLTSYQRQPQICEQDFGQRWLSRSAKKHSTLSVLEEEIHALRRKMEQLVMDGREMTSEEVVLLSTQLDLKINEYMASGKKSR
ncbi:aspartyl-phosphate phosphatase Spo0E family protein [Paenibacillus oryzisoli]|uniref:aspartyl-phosphate phosphatase Spo0E family protein n=1 Tax=Paenibacillus oryzisoli TaxID=1850517 RepID=UPI003D28E296